MSKAQSSCPTACCAHAGMDATSTTLSATRVKVSLGQTQTKKNKSKKKKENLTVAGESSAG